MKMTENSLYKEGNVNIMIDRLDRDIMGSIEEKVNRVRLIHIRIKKEILMRLAHRVVAHRHLKGAGKNL